MSPGLNFRHLHYFWVVAQEGGFARAAARLDMAVQTVSVQVRELERSLGHQLLVPQGRGLALTPAGRAAFERAEAIFALGQQLPGAVQAAATGRVARLAVGLSDGLSKLAAHTLLEPVLGEPGLHLQCHEDEFGPLLADLALHRLDVVLAGQAPPPSPGLRLISERIARSPVDWYGPKSLVRAALRRGFPQCLQTLPVLLPTAHTPLRAALDRWLDDQGLSPQVVAEFEDSALMAVFAARGLGVFAVSRLGAGDVALMPGLRLLGPCEGVHEEIHAIRARRTPHALVQRLLRTAAGREADASCARA